MGIFSGPKGASLSEPGTAASGSAGMRKDHCLGSLGTLRSPHLQDKRRLLLSGGGRIQKNAGRHEARCAQARTQTARPTGGNCREA